MGERLKARGETIALAESCTGGLIAAQLSTPAGASAYLAGSAVAYHERMKELWAGVPGALLAQRRAVSREVCAAMAEGVRAAAGATWGLSVTGHAGPTGGTEADPIGTVYIGLAGQDRTEVQRHSFSGDRDRVRSFAAATALDLLRLRLLSP